MITDKDNDQVIVEMLMTIDSQVYYVLTYKSITWLGYPLEAVGKDVGDTLSILYQRKHALMKRDEAWKS